MSDKLTYFEKLKDPRWQKKRLEVLSNSNFKCDWCSVGDETLHVHHKSYKSKTEPWDYPISNLMCLCEQCHKAVTLSDKCLRRNHKFDHINDAFHGLSMFLGYALEDCANSEEVEKLVGYLISRIGFIDIPARSHMGINTMSEAIEFITNQTLKVVKKKEKQNRGKDK